MEDEAHPVIKGLAGLAVLGGIVLSLWCTFIAFAGGTYPIIGRETDGSVVEGLVVFFIADPIIMMVAYWVTAPIAMVLSLVFKPK